MTHEEIMIAEKERVQRLITAAIDEFEAEEAGKETLCGHSCPTQRIGRTSACSIDR